MKTLFKLAAIAGCVLVCILWLRGAAIDDAGRYFVSTAATNGAYLTGYASMTMATGIVNTAASIGPNKFTNFHYVVDSGDVAVISNIWIVVTNAGNYRLSFGAGIMATALDVMAVQVWTNGPGIAPAHCSVIDINATMTASPVFETGFKMTAVFFPAGTHIFLQTTNSVAQPQQLKNVCFTVGAVN